MLTRDFYSTFATEIGSFSERTIKDKKNMKRLVILSACLAISLADWAQGNRNDSLRMDSIIHSLPDVMVKGNRPIVKVKGAALTYDLPQLIKTIRWIMPMKPSSNCLA